MSNRKTNSRALRQLAEELFERMAGADDFRQIERADFVTSLVRQWITYDGHATFFLGDRQVDLNLRRTPLGRPVVAPEPGFSGWSRSLTQDWKIDPDDLPAIFDQLNVGQSAEVVNCDGIPLRLWVNPQKRGRGVELLVKEKVPVALARDYRKIASQALVGQLGAELGPEETDELVRSVVSQWQRFEGHASLFLDSHNELHLKITEHENGDGGCDLLASRILFNLDPLLLASGFTPDVFPEVLARINLGQQVEYQDPRGVRTRMWYDPKTRSICHQPLEPVPPPASQLQLCPQCRAALPPARSGDWQQICSRCGQSVPLT
jgi:hypothetical protein